MTSSSISKILPVDSARAFAAATQYDAMSESMPDYYTMSRVRSRRGNVSVVSAKIIVGGQEWSVLARHTEDPPKKHEVAIIGGDGRGSRIVETYEPLGGETRLTIEADMKRRRPVELRRALSPGDLKSWLDGLSGAIAHAARA